MATTTTAHSPSPSPARDAGADALCHALDGRGLIAPWQARALLVSQGEGAVPALIEAMALPDERVRWEAAKALAEIASPAAAKTLVRALQDEDPSVRWIAAEGLARMGRPALLILLGALMSRAGSAWLREGAHHVLSWIEDPAMRAIVAPVRAALEGVEPAIAVMVKAHEALHLLGGGQGAPTGRSATGPAPLSRSHAVVWIRGSAGPWHHVAIHEYGP